VSNELAQKIFPRLARYTPISSLDGEKNGITPTPDLIAIGSHNTLEAGSVLVEYSYIYEPQLELIALRNKVLSDYAFRTYLGVKDVFEGMYAKSSIDTNLLPYTFTSDIEKGMKHSVDVFMLQTALTKAGVYPGLGKIFNYCPITGNFGPCTEAGVKEFQKLNKIKPTGVVGPLTRETLNAVYGK
jgi:hypothetical protein